MDGHSNTPDTTRSRRILEDHLRELYGRTVYTHKTHEKCADILFTSLARVKFWQIVLSGITTAGIVGAFFTDATIVKVSTALISAVLFVLTSYTKENDFSKVAIDHKKAASEIWLVREKLLGLLVDVSMGERPLETLQTERDILIDKLAGIYAGSPATTNKAYEMAQNSLKNSEDMTFSDEEIDRFLPRSIKRSDTNLPVGRP